MMNLTAEESEATKIKSLGPSNSMLNGFVAKSSFDSASRNKRQSSSDNINGNLTGRDKNTSTLIDPISGNYLQNKMSFSSIIDVNQELFHIGACSTTPSNETKMQKQNDLQATKTTLNGHTPTMLVTNSLKDVRINPQSCDQNSNNHNPALPDCSTYSTPSLKSFSSQINSALKKSEYLDGMKNLYHNNHNHHQQKKQESDQQLNFHQQQQKELQVWYCVQFRRLCQFCVITPLIGLVGCLSIACILQFGDIQETACKVSKEMLS